MTVSKESTCSSTELVLRWINPSPFERLPPFHTGEFDRYAVELCGVKDVTMHLDQMRCNSLPAPTP